MADILEDDDDNVVDVDRKNDERSFQKEQFDIFVETYRESAHPRTGTLTFSDTPSDVQLKKDCINTKRRLSRAKFSIEAMPDSELMSEYLQKADSIIKELDKLVIRRKEPDDEFKLHNVPLPDYNPTDMELLFGDGDGSGDGAKDQEHSGHNVITPNDGSEVLSVLDSTLRSRIMELLGAADMLLIEYDHLMQRLKGINH